jgi:hypothetical protein
VVEGEAKSKGKGVERRRLEGQAQARRTAADAEARSNAKEVERRRLEEQAQTKRESQQMQKPRELW